MKPTVCCLLVMFVVATVTANTRLRRSSASSSSESDESVSRGVLDDGGREDAGREDTTASYSYESSLVSSVRGDPATDGESVPANDGATDRGDGTTTGMPDMTGSPAGLSAKSSSSGGIVVFLCLATVAGVVAGVGVFIYKRRHTAY